MIDLNSVSFYVALALLATHEIDAVKRQEWRLLPILKKLDDEAGFWWFTALHIPIYALFFAWVDVGLFRVTLSTFCIIHAGLHWLLRKAPHYQFSGGLSNGLIYGAAVCGAIYIVLNLL